VLKILHQYYNLQVSSINRVLRNLTAETQKSGSVGMMPGSHLSSAGSHVYGGLFGSQAWHRSAAVAAACGGGGGGVSTAGVTSPGGGGPTGTCSPWYSSAMMHGAAAAAAAVHAAGGSLGSHHQLGSSLSSSGHCGITASHLGGMDRKRT